MDRREYLGDADMARYQLAAIVESSYDAILSKTLDGIVTSWNTGAERLYGYSAEEMVGQPVSRLLPPGAHDELPRILEQIRSDERVLPYVTERIARDGRHLTVFLTVSPIRNGAGTIIGASAIARDITAQKALEQERAELFEREQTARVRAEQAAATLWRLQTITDAALGHLSLDELLLELLQRVQHIMGVDVSAILLLEGDMLVVRAAIGLGDEFTPNLRIPLGAGFVGRIAASREPVILTNITIKDVFNPLLIEKGVRSVLGVPLMVEGAVTGILHVGSLPVRQFTDEESRLLQLAADRVALSIDRARLFAELQEADQRKNDFVATVAHELRTPLSAISNAVYILENIQLPDERAGRHLGTVNRQARQLGRLVEDLLDISRISRGKIELRMEAVSIQTMANESISAVQPLMEARGQDLIADLPPESIMVEGDPVRLEQIITNLLGNATKYTEAGGTVSLRVEKESAWAVVRVRDTGIGVDPPMLPQIFDLFHQIDPNASRSEGGLGIGLALVKRLVELHGGTVIATSNGLGAGTEFTVRLPLLGTPVSSDPVL